ncbi:hypothetical protein D3C75_1088180 [compost metagenome]
MRVNGTDGHVAATDQAQRTAEGGTLDHGQGRHLELGQVVHQFGQLAGIVEVGAVIQRRRLLHPGQVGTGAEVPATAAQQDEAQAGVGAELVDGQNQLADHLRVEGVVLVFPA